MGPAAVGERASAVAMAAVERASVVAMAVTAAIAEATEATDTVATASAAATADMAGAVGVSGWVSGRAIMATVTATTRITTPTPMVAIIPPDTGMPDTAIPTLRIT